MSVPKQGPFILVARYVLPHWQQLCRKGWIGDWWARASTSQRDEAGQLGCRAGHQDSTCAVPLTPVPPIS